MRERGTRRRVFASDGTEWSVYELPADGIPGARGPACLVFDSPGCARRVWSYPDGWRTLSDHALMALSQGR